MTFDGPNHTPAEAALALAAAGLPVFPCDGRPKSEDKQRYPGEPRKSPLTPRGFYDATTDPATVAAWWRANPDALPGVPMGEPSGLFILDADIDKETGEATGETTLAALGLIPAGHRFSAATRSGGWHFVFQWREGLPGNSVKGLEGVDIRSHGGYVIAWTPETLIAAKGAADLDAPPSAVLDALRQATERRRQSHGARPGTQRFSFDPGSAPFFAAVKNAALANLSAWVQRLFPTAVYQPGTGAWRVRSRDLGRALEEDLSLHPEGIQDFGEERPLTAIDVVMHWGGKATSLEAAEWLCDALGLDPAALGRVSGSGAPVSTKPAQGGAGGDQWPAPDMTLLRPERRAAPALPLEATFGAVWARWIADAADAKGAPPDYVAAAVLAVAGSLIGNARWVAPWAGWAEPPIVWAVLIGAPSAGKSPALDAALSPLHALERRLRREAERELAEWQENAEAAALALEAWKADAKKALKAGQEPPKKPETADPGPAPHVPRLAVNDATVERLAVILSKQPRGTLAMRDELAGWLANMSRYANGGSDKPFWLEAYGGRAFTVERMSRPSLRVERLTVGALGGIQPDRLSSLLIKADDDGMLARLVPVWPEPAPVKRPDAAPDEALAEEAFSRLYGLAMPTDEEGEAQPCFIPFAEPARTILDDFRRWVREEEAGEAGLMQSFIGKFPGLAARLAIILAHLDWAVSAGCLPPDEVTADHFGRAVGYVGEYALPMARRAYAEASVPSEERAAQHLARLIVEEHWEKFTLRDVTRRERQGLRRNADVEPALDVLTQAGWIRADRQASGPKGGRPQMLFRVNPAVRWQA